MGKRFREGEEREFGVMGQGRRLGWEEQSGRRGLGSSPATLHLNTLPQPSPNPGAQEDRSVQSRWPDRTVSDFSKSSGGRQPLRTGPDRALSPEVGMGQTVV
jgi:hypothetical protein